MVELYLKIAVSEISIYKSMLVVTTLQIEANDLLSNSTGETNM